MEDIFVDFKRFFFLVGLKYSAKNDTMVNVDELIPHRPPIRVITEALCLEDDFGRAKALVTAQWPLCDGKTASAMMLIEAIAQTAALVEGYKNKQKGQAGVKGWLVGIKSAEFYRERIKVGVELVVDVKSLYSFEDYAVIEGEVKEGQDLVAKAVLQAVKFEGDAPISQAQGV